MDERTTGQTSGEPAVTEGPSLAAHLLRAEFGAPTPVLDESASAPLVAPVPAADVQVATGSAIHEEFAQPVRPSSSRSQRAGMLAGLGVIGALLAALVVLSPGSGQPRLPVQSVHDVSPIAASGVQTAAATVPPTSPPSTPSTTSSTTPPTSPPHRSATVPTTATYQYAPAPAPATTAPAAPPTTAAPAPTTTTAPPPPPTTAPPTTTTTRLCILGLIC